MDDIQSESAATAQVSSLVADIADRSPFDVEWSDLDVAHVEAFLAGTQEDEPLHWEAKGGEVTPDHVRRAVAAFANREGGYVIIGAERDRETGSWRLPGVEFRGTEPRTWLSHIIRTSLSPPPEFDIHAWDRPDGKKAAVVRVQPNAGFLTMSAGRVYYRRPGESSYVENGAELQRIHDTVRYRSRALPGGGHPPSPPAHGVMPSARSRLTVDLDADTAAAVVQALVEEGRANGVNVYLAGVQESLRAAADAGDEGALREALDRLVTVAGVAVSYDPAGDLARRSISELHGAFDLGVRLQRRSSGYSAERLFAEVLARARAVGALAVRLRHWSPLRHLMLHDVPDEDVSLFSGWFRYGDVWASRANLYRQDNNLIEGGRRPIRLAAEATVRLAALRPDGIVDEDALVTSICQFDFFLNAVLTREALPGDAQDAASPTSPRGKAVASVQPSPSSCSTPSVEKRCCRTSATQSLRLWCFMSRRTLGAPASLLANGCSGTA